MEQQPFYVGQKVVCVSSNRVFTKGVPYTINECVMCECGTWYVSTKEEYNGGCKVTCSKCHHLHTNTSGFWYAYASRFAPLNPPRVSAIPELLKAPVEETLDVIKTKEVV